tara:strand:- start:12482 stop:12643 length:162 start_codon:yes stop_codon:yes gene_type:complete
MNERDLYESMQNLNPCVDKLGRDRDFKENIIQCINYLSDKIKEIERRLDEKTE